MQPDDAENGAVTVHIPEHLFGNSEFTTQRQLLARILDVLVRNERFPAAWLGGSFARGEGDAQSDLDVQVAVVDDAYPELVARWGELIDGVTPTVLKRLLRFGGTTVLSAITPDWQRFDLTLEPLAATGQPIGAPRLLLFDRGEVSRRLGPVRPVSPLNADEVRSLVEEFLRVLGLQTVVLNRGEFLVGIEGVMLLRRSLVNLMLAENGVRQGGALRLNQLLSAEQRAILEQIPPVSPTRESVIEANLACTRAFVPIARRVLHERGVDYPDDLDAATRAHLQRHLRDERWIR